MKLPIATLAAALTLAGCAAANIQDSRNDALFSRIRPGDSRAAVEQLLGPPDTRVTFERSGNEGWDYKYMDGWGYMAFYSITFSRDGHVVSSISNRINAGGDMH